jgi:protein-S-isoprenylcysteine O-methyltransferase Ste14
MSRSAYVWAGLAVFALLGALYAFAGIAMVASLTVPETQARDARSIVWWGIACMVALLLAVAFGIAAWKRRRRT